MYRTYRHDRLIPASVWVRLTTVSTGLLCSFALLACTVSLVAVSTGDPELVALVALAGVVVLGVGLAAVRLFEGLERDGLPVLE